MGTEVFRDMVDGSSVGFFALDRCGRFVYLNRALAGLFGYRVEELRGESAVELLVHSEDRERVKAEAGKVLAGERPFGSVTFRGLRRDGGEFYGEALFWAVRSGGRPLFVGNLLDVTEKVISQRKLSLIRELGRKAILLPIRSQKGIIAASVREKRPIYVPNTGKEPRYLPGKPPPVRSSASL